MARLALSLAAAFAGALACAPTAASEPALTAPEMSARGVRIDIADDTGAVTARADRLTVEERGDHLVLDGRAGVTFARGADAFEAGADRLEIRLPGPTILLSGRVRARFFARAGE